jgi:tetratricopeptide (TPR) repeat protein/transcriptional regulator with XRE-family HTH domain
MKGIRNTANDQEKFSTFGRALRALRNEQGLSLAALAELTHYSKGHLNNVEHGTKAPTLELAQTCDDALATGETLQCLVPERPRSGQAGPLRPAQLPATSRRFVGRRLHLQQLDLLLSETEQAPVGAIHGPPGVGKTELALQWARRNSSRFPDGELYVDLHGHASSGSPVDPADTLEDFLLALGWLPDRMPTTADERAALFRSVTRDRRMMLLLDNAASSAQVRPLVPTGSGNIVLVTSRSRLEGLAVRDGASEVPLQPFEPDEALALLRDVVGQHRVDAQLDHATEVVRCCGGLPLAVRLAAERVAAHPGFTMQILARDLAEEHARLDTLSAGDDEDTAIRTVFSWSYRNLPVVTARMFRLLGLHPGPTIGVPAAAALGDLTAEQARQQLEALANGHLIEQMGPGRFRLHDLMRLYAAERCTAEETEDARRQAVLRELTYYLHTAEAAGAALVPTAPANRAPRHEEAPPSPLFPTYDVAMVWCEEELANLVRSARTALDERMFDIAWRLPAALFEFFHIRKPWNTWEKTYRIGLTAARSAHDEYGEACMHQGLGLVCLGRRQTEHSRDHHQHALRIRIDIGDRRGQAWSMTALGQTFTLLGDVDEAATHLQQALGLHHDVGDPQGEAVTLVCLAELRRRQDAIDDAIDYSLRALPIARSIDDRHGEGLVLHQLGDLCLTSGRIEDALDYLRQTVEVQRTAGDHKGEADTLFLLAQALIQAGRSSEAKPYLLDALEIFEARDDPAAAEVQTVLHSRADS